MRPAESVRKLKKSNEKDFPVVNLKLRIANIHMSLLEAIKKDTLNLLNIIEKSLESE